MVSERGRGAPAEPGEAASCARLRWGGLGACRLGRLPEDAHGAEEVVVLREAGRGCGVGDAGARAGRETAGAARDSRTPLHRHRFVLSEKPAREICAAKTGQMHKMTGQLAHQVGYSAIRVQESQNRNSDSLPCRRSPYNSPSSDACSHPDRRDPPDAYCRPRCPPFLCQGRGSMYYCKVNSVPEWLRRSTRDSKHKCIGTEHRSSRG